MSSGPSPPPDGAPDEEVRIGAWIVERALGHGGAGTVLLCRSAHSARIYAAIKLLDPRLATKERARRRFKREAEILSLLDHPNIVKVSSFSLEHNPPYLEMEYVDGEPVEDLLESGETFSYKQIVRIARELASALQYMHSRGVFHRDIKPGNLILRRDGVLKMVDFGLAKEDEGDRLTAMGAKLGTVAYAPPEWDSPDPIDPERWDCYALGVVLWEMLTGDQAFVVEASSPVHEAALVMVQKRQVPWLDPGDAFPRDIRKFIKRATARDLDSAITTSADLVEALAALDETGESGWTEESEHGVEPVDVDALPVPVEFPVDTPVDTPATVRSGIPLRTLVLLVAAPLLLLGGLLAGGAGVVLAQLLTEDRRDVTVVVEGTTAELGVRIGQALPIGAEGQTFRFRQIPVGPVTIHVVEGAGCGQVRAIQRCPGDRCPRECRTLKAEADVVGGDGTQEVRILASQ